MSSSDAREFVSGQERHDLDARRKAGFVNRTKDLPANATISEAPPIPDEGHTKILRGGDASNRSDRIREAFALGKQAAEQNT